MNGRDIAAALYGTLDSVAASEAAASARVARAAAGLVRLETSQSEFVRPTSEEQRIRDAARRSLRVYKSISCAGDLMRLSRDENGGVLDGVFVTLTYRPDVDWSAGQISGYIQNCRTWANERGIKLRYCWVAEQHKSGRIHYHAIFFLPALVKLPKPDESGWWPHGMSKIERLRKMSVGYLIKYATKQAQPSAPWPKGCRLSGHGGLDPAQRIRRAWWVLPKYIRERVDEFKRVRRAKGGGWESPVTGEWWAAWCGPHGSPVGAR